MDKLIEKHLNVTDMSFYPLEQAEKYANITKEIACGFFIFMKEYTSIDELYYCLKKEYITPKIDRMWKLDELFDLYLKSL